MITNENVAILLNAPSRKIIAKVDLYKGSTFDKTLYYDGPLISASVDRIGEATKFFGYGICQKATVKLRDKERSLNVDKEDAIRVAFGVGETYETVFPRKFFVEEVTRDENTNDLTVVGYDAIYKAAKHNVSELELAESYTIGDIAKKIGVFLGTTTYYSSSIAAFAENYPQGANFNGNETLREVLDAIAEATQTIYYIAATGYLTFKRLDRTHEAVFTIDKSQYFTMTSKTRHSLETIISSTDLGDDLFATTGNAGDKQFIRNNPFWDLREDLDILLTRAIEEVGGLSINQFECKWRGNFLLEIGDKIDLITKDNEVITAYVLNDVLNYDGGLVENTKWEFINNSAESMGNPVTIGESIKNTYARVDKANKRIDLVVSEANATSESLTNLQLATDNINASVSQIQSNMGGQFENVDKELENLRTEVSAMITSEEAKLEIKKEIANGVNKVTTATGYTFDEDGMTVSKSGSEMTTTITDNGMTVYKNSQEVLTANNEGVKAEDLHATTFLIIGANSRFEDYVRDGAARTGCFWIGG